MFAVFSDLAEVREFLFAAHGDAPTGATIISHGGQFEDSGGDSLAPLADAVLQRADGGWLVDFDIAADGQQAVFEVTRRAGAGGEVVVLFDWAPGSNELSSGWAEAAGDALFTALVGMGLVDLAAGAVQPVPLHLMGHSFGTIVTSEAVERLAAFDVAVDHVTYLDPHDFDQGIAQVEPAQQMFTVGVPQVGQGYGASVWENIAFADVYYQTQEIPFPDFDLDPDGRPIPGAYHERVTQFELFQLPHTAIWEDIYRNSILDDGIVDRYGYSRLGGNAGGRPAPNFYDSGQDHRHTPGEIVLDDGSANHAGLAAAGLTADQIIAGRWPFEIDPYALTNGDFTHPGDEHDDDLLSWDNIVPGWSHHGGGGNAHVVEQDGQFALELRPFGDHRTHNRFFAPGDASRIAFSLSVADGSATDTLRVKMGDTLLAEYSLDPGEIPGANRFGGFEWVTAAIPPLLRESIQTLTFELSSSDLFHDSVVRIDDVRMHSEAANDVLTVIGTPGDDVIELHDISHSEARLVVNGAESVIDKRIIRRIEVLGGAGADRFGNFSSIDASFDGGAGDDRLVLDGVQNPLVLAESGSITLSAGAAQVWSSVAAFEVAGEIELASGDLLVSGGPQNDEITFYPGSHSGETYVRINGVFHGPFAPTGRLAAVGGDGNDRIGVLPNLPWATLFVGGGGNDRLYGGWQDDVLIGGDGRDLLLGAYGQDRLEGGAGNDVLRGQSHDDLIFGGPGQDILDGGRGNDILRGGEDGDLLRGSFGNDILLGEGGRDRLYANVGRNLLLGGANRDRLQAGDDGDLMISGPTAYDNNDSALLAILAEWASSRTLTERVANLTAGVDGLGGDDYALTLGTTVFNDHQWSYLIGGGGEDWFFKYRTDILFNYVPAEDQVTH